MLCSLSACQKEAAEKPAASPTPAPKATASVPAAVKIVSAEPTSFDAIGRHLDSGGGMYFFISAEGFLKSASVKLTGMASALMDSRKMDVVTKAKVEAGWKSLAHFTANSGINEISGVGASSIALEPGYYQNKWMLHHYEGKGSGLIWNISGSTPNAVDFASYLPQTTALAASGNRKLDLLWKALDQEAASNADLRQGLDLLTQQFKNSTGLDLAPVLASLGPNYSLVITADPSRMTNVPAGKTGNTVSIPEPAVAILIQVQDDVVINRIDQQLSVLPMVIKSEENGMSIRSVSLPMPLPFVRPVVAWKKGILILSSSDLLLKEMFEIKAGKKPGLAANPLFKKLMTGLPTTGCGFAYVSPSFQQTINDFQLATMKQQNASDPAMEKFLKLVQDAVRQGPQCSVVEVTPEGYLVTSHGSTGPAKLVAIGAALPVAMVAAVSVPAIVAAKTQAKARAQKQEEFIKAQSRPPGASPTPSQPDKISE